MITRIARAAFHFFKYRIYYGVIVFHYGVFQQKRLIGKTDRSQSHTYTTFNRSPGQLNAVIGPVMDFLLKGRPNGPLTITVFAGSTGAESYTLASALMKRFPSLDFKITASDLHQEMVDRGIAATYSAAEVHNGPVTPQFIDETFDRQGNQYVVKPAIRSRVTFQQANLLDPNLVNQFGPADLVLAQNVFCHLDESLVRKAFPSVISFLKAKSVLMIDGMDLNLREELTLKANLNPLDYQLRSIHESARRHIADRWWTSYYGMEPYAPWKRNKARRYGTIFFKGADSE